MNLSVLEKRTIPSEFGTIHLTIVGFSKAGEYGMVTAQLDDGELTTVHHGYDKRAAEKDAIMRLLEQEKRI